MTLPTNTKISPPDDSEIQDGKTEHRRSAIRKILIGIGIVLLFLLSTVPQTCTRVMREHEEMRQNSPSRRPAR